MQWHHITGVYDGSKTYIYWDAQLVATSQDEFTGAVNTTLFPIIISREWGNLEHFDGSMRDLSLWDTALPQSEIQQYMQCPPIGDEEGLVGYWNFNEGSGTTAIDLSGNGNDGTIIGATYSEDVPDSDCTNCSSIDSISVTFLSSGCTA